MIKKVPSILSYIFFSCLTVCMCLLFLNVLYFHEETKETETSKDTITEKCQQKLAELGLYGGEINGIYDVSTSEAVRKFQLYQGLRPDGVITGETLAKLGITDISYSDFELETLARFIEANSDNSTLLEMTAIAEVILNRMKSPRFPSSMLDVITQKNQFECVKDGSFYRVTPTKLAYRAANDAFAGISPAEGAVFFGKQAPSEGFIRLKTKNFYFYTDY